MSKEIILQNLELSANYSGNIKLKPMSRAQASFTLKDHYAYLFGGINSSALGDLWQFNLREYTWKHIQPISTIEDSNMIARYGHSSVYHPERNEILFYGGNRYII